MQIAMLVRFWQLLDERLSACISDERVESKSWKTDILFILIICHSCPPNVERRPYLWNRAFVASVQQLPLIVTFYKNSISCSYKASVKWYRPHTKEKSFGMELNRQVSVHPVNQK